MGLSFCIFLYFQLFLLLSVRFFGSLFFIHFIFSIFLSIYFAFLPLRFSFFMFCLFVCTLLQVMSSVQPIFVTILASCDDIAFVHVCLVITGKVWDRVEALHMFYAMAEGWRSRSISVDRVQTEYTKRQSCAHYLSWLVVDKLRSKVASHIRSVYLTRELCSFIRFNFIVNLTFSAFPQSLHSLRDLC